MTFQSTLEGTDGGDPSGAILSDAKYKAANATAMFYDRQHAARANYNAYILVAQPIAADVITMTSVAEIIYLFQSAADEQSKVNGTPNDDHTLK